VKRAALVVCLLTAAALAAQPGADEHLLAGARFFQQDRYAEALVEFRVAERTGAGGSASWYVAAALVKLGRFEEAMVVFARAEAAAPGDRDALLDYYRALACYGARLYVRADRLLAGLGDQPGPRIAAQARKIRADLAPVLAAAPSNGTIDWYHARGEEAVRAGKAALASAYFEEAVSLAARRPDTYRRAEAVAALRRLGGAGPAAGKTREAKRP